MKKTVVIISLLSYLLTGIHAGEPQFSKADSLKVCELLNIASRQHSGINYMVFFARALLGVPYVGQTLERNHTEQLIVNLQEMDCTTFVENCTALSLCMLHNRKTFNDFIHFLQAIRYSGGRIDYPTRNHYFTQWILSNIESGIVNEFNSPAPPFRSKQTINVGYMTTHPDLYPMLKGRPDWIEAIRAKEDSINGITFSYIPKSLVTNTKTLRNAVHNGDILAIVTSKAGLDIAHVGIAVWHDDGLHLLNASSIHKKTVEEPMTLRTYLYKHPTQLGIRVVRLL